METLKSVSALKTRLLCNDNLWSLAVIQINNPKPTTPSDDDIDADTIIDKDDNQDNARDIINAFCDENPFEIELVDHDVENDLFCLLIKHSNNKTDDSHETLNITLNKMKQLAKQINDETKPWQSISVSIGIAKFSKDENEIEWIDRATHLMGIAKIKCKTSTLNGLESDIFELLEEDITLNNSQQNIYLDYHIIIA